MRDEKNRGVKKLEIENLTVGYHGVPLISDISISLEKGEIVTLIGPNGSGKSTILKSITKHLAPIAGTVYIDGKDMRNLSGKDIATRMAVVLTDRVRPDLMTCREMVAAARYPYTGSFGILTEHDKEVVDRSLDCVHALDVADQYVTAISDGQRQRVLLARAICQEPEIIVLDEPTSFLDIRHKIELLEILSNMAKREGITVLMSLHEIDLAERISDRIVCVKGDRIAAYGTPAEIFSNETIAELYGIESGCFNALLGSVELSAPHGEIRCFVIGGNGCGIPFYRALQKRGIPFAAGILMPNDLDVAVAEPLAERVLCSEAFMPITDSLVDMAMRAIDSVPFVVDSGCPVGDYNSANEKLLSYAKERGKTVLTSLKDLAEAEL